MSAIDGSKAMGEQNLDTQHCTSITWTRRPLAWEQRKLRELGKTQSGIGSPENEQGGVDGVPLFKISDMNNTGNENEMNAAKNYVSLAQLQRKSWKPIDSVPAVVFAKVGAAIMLDRKRIVGSQFDARNLRRMMQFPTRFQDMQIVSPLATQLSWSPIVELLPIESDEAFLYYANDVVARSLSKRELLTKGG
jgi:hypothetical protein